jgi:ribosomal protein S18 acetylase RimI-like enzyme
MQALIDFVFPPQLVEDDDLRAARVITQAFMKNKCYTEIFRGDEESRREAMEFLFRRNLFMVRKRCPESIHCVEDENGNVQCFFMLVPSTAAHSSLYEKIIVGGILEFGVRYGMSTLLRLIKVADFSDNTEKEMMAGRDSYYSLQRMIVAPELQGKGVGSKYLGEALNEADRKQLPVVMSTQEPRNLIYYGRL